MAWLKVPNFGQGIQEMEIKQPRASYQEETSFNMQMLLVYCGNGLRIQNQELFKSD